MKTAICVCSNSGIDYVDFSEEITVFRSSIQFGAEETYLDFVELKNKEFYERIARNPDDVPKTAYTPIGVMMEAFEEFEKKGYDEVIVICISSRLSNLFDAVKNLDNLVNIRVHAFDSKTVAYAQTYMALTAYEMTKQGKNSSEILPILEKFRANTMTYFTVDTLKYLVKNGRLSKFAGALGGLLGIRPILQIEKDGKVATLEKAKGSKKALRRVVELYANETMQMENLVTYIVHADYENGVEIMKEEIKKAFPNREVVACPLTPVVGAHGGPKSIGIGYICLD